MDNKTPRFTYRCNGTIQWYADRPGFVYLLDIGGGLFKVGRSVHPDKRLKEIANAYRCRPTMIHKIAVPDMKVAELKVRRMFYNRPRPEWHMFEWAYLSRADVRAFKKLTADDLCPKGM